jgi:hypothetical protein
MKIVTAAGVLTVVVVLMFFILVMAGRAAFDVVKGFEVAVALLTLDVAQDAERRGDELLSTVAAIVAMLFALFPLATS